MSAALPRRPSALCSSWGPGRSAAFTRCRTHCARHWAAATWTSRAVVAVTVLPALADLTAKRVAAAEEAKLAAQRTERAAERQRVTEQARGRRQTVVSDAREGLWGRVIANAIPAISTGFAVVDAGLATTHQAALWLAGGVALMVLGAGAIDLLLQRTRRFGTWALGVLALVWYLVPIGDELSRTNAVTMSVLYAPPVALLAGYAIGAVLEWLLDRLPAGRGSVPGALGWLSVLAAVPLLTLPVTRLQAETVSLLYRQLAPW